MSLFDQDGRTPNTANCSPPDSSIFSTVTCSSAMWTGTDLRLVTIRFSAAVGTSSTHTTGNRLIIAWLSSEFFII